MNSVLRGPSPPEPGSEALAVLAALRFLRMLRHRMQYMVLALVAFGLLGGFYYLAKSKVYRATSSLLITHSGADVLANPANPTGPRDSLIPTYEKLITSELVVNDALQRLQEAPAALKVDFADHPAKEWPDVLRKNLGATAQRRTNIIDISYRSKAPEAGEAVVRAVVDSYLDFMEKHHKDASAQTVEILDNERVEIEQRLADRQAELLDVMHRVRDLGLGNETNVIHPAVQRVTRLNETLVEVQKERVHLQGTLSAVRTAIARGDDLRQHLLTVAPEIGRELMLHGMGLSPQNADAVNKVEQKLLDDRARLAMLNRHLGSAHPDVAEVTESIRNAELYLASCRASVNQRLSHVQDDQLGPLLLAMVEQKLADASAHERELFAQYERSEAEAVGLSGRRAELQIVENEIQRLRSLHEVLLNRIANVDMNQDRSDVNVAVVSEPSASDKAIAPKLATVLAICLVGGIGGGAVLVYIIDLLDDRFRSPEELSDQLGLPLLAMVGKLPATDGSGADAVHLHVDPTAVESEAFRTLRTTLSLAGESRERIAITSSQPSDGKTTVITNLAVAFAQAGKKTLLIDADLRRPGLSKLLEMRGQGGLSDVLRPGEDIGEACRKQIQWTGIEGLDVLPCGSRPADPAEALGRARMAELIAWTEGVYDQILIDCPPMLAASDAALVGRLVDAVILVVKPAENPRRAVLRSAGVLSTMHVNVAGVVANFMGDAGSGSYYGYGADFGYGYGTSYDDEETFQDTFGEDGLDDDYHDDDDAADDYIDEDYVDEGQAAESIYPIVPPSAPQRAA